MMAIAPEGKPILLVTALIAILCVSAALWLNRGSAAWPAVVGLLPLAFSLWFFRDPVRRIPPQAGIVIAAADGKIIEITRVEPGPVHAFPALKVSTFMSPLDVHVNRIPVGGRVRGAIHCSGKFAAAFKGKASLDNERQYLLIDTPYGPVGCAQIAGWLARRIICHLKEGQTVATGERYGLIRFGSRLDLYLPPDCEIKVKVGQKVRAGETIIGVFHEKT
jgi:phosphatidylserine decarboxylase